MKLADSLELSRERERDGRERERERALGAAIIGVSSAYGIASAAVVCPCC